MKLHKSSLFVTVLIMIIILLCWENIQSGKPDSRLINLFVLWFGVMLRYTSNRITNKE